MKNIYNHKLSILLGTLMVSSTLFIHAVAIADVAIITHPDSVIGSIDKNTVKSIYLGKLKSWPDGSSLTVIDQKAGNSIRKLFINEVVGKKVRKFDSYWSRKAFSGKGIPPKNLGNDKDVKIEISNKKGSIGYIDLSEVDNSIKVLLIVK